MAYPPWSRRGVTSAGQVGMLRIEKRHQTFRHFSSTPLLQHSNTPKPIEIEAAHNRLSSFGS